MHRWEVNIGLKTHTVWKYELVWIAQNSFCKHGNEPRVQKKWEISWAVEYSSVVQGKPCAMKLDTVKQKYIAEIQIKL